MWTSVLNLALPPQRHSHDAWLEHQQPVIHTAQNKREKMKERKRERKKGRKEERKKEKKGRKKGKKGKKERKKKRKEKVIKIKNNY